MGLLLPGWGDCRSLDIENMVEGSELLWAELAGFER